VSYRWRELFDKVKTVRTQVMQLWLARDLSQLGFPVPSSISTGHAFPHSSWADFSHLLPMEEWPSDGPRALAYFCGPYPDNAPSDRKGANVLARETAGAWLRRSAGHLWPAALCDNGFDWKVLWDDQGREGERRLDAQYVAANTAASDHYVQSLPGSAR